MVLTRVWHTTECDSLLGLWSLGVHTRATHHGVLTTWAHDEAQCSAAGRLRALGSTTSVAMMRMRAHREGVTDAAGWWVGPRTGTVAVLRGAAAAHAAPARDQAPGEHSTPDSSRSRPSASHSSFGHSRPPDRSTCTCRFGPPKPTPKRSAKAAAAQYAPHSSRSHERGPTDSSHCTCRTKPKPGPGKGGARWTGALQPCRGNKSLASPAPHAALCTEESPQSSRCSSCPALLCRSKPSCPTCFHACCPCSSRPQCPSECVSWRGLPLWRWRGACTAASAGRANGCARVHCRYGLRVDRRRGVGGGAMGGRGRAQLLEYAIGAVWKACQNCEANRAVVRAHGIRAIEALSHDDSLSPEISRYPPPFMHPLPPHIPPTTFRLPRDIPAVALSPRLGRSAPIRSACCFTC